MTLPSYFGAAAALLFAATALPAAAETVDAATISCETLTKGVEAKNMTFVNAILNWMGGYHATEKQGTSVEWAKLAQAFDETIAFCGENPNIGVMSASEKFMGEEIEDAGPKSYDLAIVTCENALSDKSVLKDLGETLMWLSGYHTSMSKDKTMIDLDKFVKDTEKIANYCAAHPRNSLVTASEKYMAE